VINQAPLNGFELSVLHSDLLIPSVIEQDAEQGLGPVSTLLKRKCLARKGTPAL
jgi:hypothetical protein